MWIPEVGVPTGLCERWVCYMTVYWSRLRLSEEVATSWARRNLELVAWEERFFLALPCLNLYIRSVYIGKFLCTSSNIYLLTLYVRYLFPNIFPISLAKSYGCISLVAHDVMKRSVRGESALGG